MDWIERWEYVRRAYNFVYKNVTTIIFILITVLLLILFQRIPPTIHKYNQSVKRQKQAVKSIDSLSIKVINPYNYNKTIHDERK